MAEAEHDDQALRSSLEGARAELEREMSTERACEEVRAAMGHVDQALRELGRRDERLAGGLERARLEAQARDSGEYDRYEGDPRDDDPGDVGPPGPA